MKKTIKKLDNQIINALTRACEAAKDRFPDFAWLTHTADYADFPGSLRVRCVFKTKAALMILKQLEEEGIIVKIIHAELLKIGVLLKTPKRHIIFASKEVDE